MEGKAVSGGWTAMPSPIFSRSGLGSFSYDPGWISYPRACLGVPVTLWSTSVSPVVRTLSWAAQFSYFYLSCFSGLSSAHP